MNRYFFVSWPGLEYSILVCYITRRFPSQVRDDAASWLGINREHIHAVPAHGEFRDRHERLIIRHIDHALVTLDKGT